MAALLAGVDDVFEVGHASQAGYKRCEEAPGCAGKRRQDRRGFGHGGDFIV